ncbi:MAG: argininosuccinate lyase [Thermodesulfobacteriota bacterium]
MKKQKAWSGRFAKQAHKLSEEFNASIGFDVRLFAHDIRGSIAHATVLCDAGVITKQECKKIITGLKKVERELSRGLFAPGIECEDIHMAVESRLSELIGPLGGKLHTGRSRNDQVALDIRLYLRDEIGEILRSLNSFKAALLGLAESNTGVIMPGYTHLQRAQPVLLAHHLLAYYEMFCRDTTRLVDCLARFDELPLGAGALAGSPYKLDRKLTAKLLGFSRVTRNSMDSVSDRDFVVEFLAVASIMIMHFSRLSEELVLWSSQEFAFVDIAEEFSTGSSIMPQKKNPDIAELARGKTGRVYGSLMSLLTLMKGLPLAYNKDMQEDKEPLFDTVDTIKAILGVYAPMMRSLRFNGEKTLTAAKKGFLNATDAADYLVNKGLPFREAHRVMGRVVRYCMDKHSDLEGLTMKEWTAFSKLFGVDIKDAISIEKSIKSRGIAGGTAPGNVRNALKKAKKEVAAEAKRVYK